MRKAAKKESLYLSRAALLVLLLLGSGLLSPFTAKSAEVVYACNGSNNTIVRFAPGGVNTVFASYGLNDPEALAFDRSGDLYAANLGDGTIERFTPQGVGSRFATFLNSPDALAFDAVGNLYVASYFDSTIWRYSPTGTRSLFARIGLDNPTALAFDRSGNLLVANYAGNEGFGYLERFTPSGVGSLFNGTALAHPVALAFDGAGNLYEGSANNTVVRFASNGVPSLFADYTTLHGLRALAADSQDNLYAACYYNSSIERYNPQGSASLLNSLGLDGPTALAIQTIPEPAAGLLICVGLGTIAVVRRTHRFE